jgi:hypothetical protein
MRDLTGPCPAVCPKGLAFEIADLVLVKSWADHNNFRMSICLDHGAAVDEEYEEVIAFQTPKSRLYRFIMWHNAEAVFVQPLVGRKKRYESVAKALECLLPVVLTDIIATRWPTEPNRAT